MRVIFKKQGGKPDLAPSHPILAPDTQRLQDKGLQRFGTRDQFCGRQFLPWTGVRVAPE